MTAKRKFRRGKSPQNLPHAYCSLMPLMAAGMLSSVVYARPPVDIPGRYELPVPTTRPGLNFVFNGSIEGGSPIYSGSQNQVMTINQATHTLGLNWDTFNIGEGATVKFIQPNANSRVLNRIWGADMKPSVILGNMEANGQVYILNQNGVLFGNGSQVNVGGLLASALSIGDSALLDKGLPRTKGDRLEFTWEGDASNFATKGFVAVDAGAKITTASGGKVVLLAPASVENLGLIQSAGGNAGEAILAAGGKVVLTAPNDPDLRGLLVEATPVVKDGITYTSTVVNQGSGSNGGISAANVTLAAMAVNQQGRINASRAVNLNGEIMLVSGQNNAPEVNLNLTSSKATIGWTSQHDGTTPQTVNVVQAGDVQEIEWHQGFKVDAGQSFVFSQPKTGAVVYNYVYDPDHFSSTAGRSVIDGGLSATGKLYLINEKGISFTANARVKAADFVASALGMNPLIVNTGLLGQTKFDQRTFYLTKAQRVVADAADAAAARAAALADFNESVVNVASGARIETGTGGVAMLLGGKVMQGGTIVTPGGQTILAAGADVYLRPPSAQNFRGYAAEVNPLYLVQGWNDNLWEAISRGVNANRVVNTGSVYASFGDISLIGHEIVQKGTLTASTSLNRNGSIHLHARDQLVAAGLSDINTGEPPSGISSINDGTGIPKLGWVTGTVGGKLTLGAGSKTQVLLDPQDGRQGAYGSDGRFYKTDANGVFLRDAKGKLVPWDEITQTAGQSFTPSTIDAAAASIEVQGREPGVAGASLLAHGGKIRFLANERFSELNNIFDTSNFSNSSFQADKTQTPGPASIFIGSGAVLDVSGVTVEKSVRDLYIEAELRGDEFADNPFQRYGYLRGLKVYVDVRDKVKIADLSGYLGKVGQNLYERNTTGGEISLKSTGSVIVKKDALLDVSGGRINYAGGYVTETHVFGTSGRLMRLNDVAADFLAMGSYDVTRYEAAYSEGKSAGSIEVNANSIALDGNLQGRVHRGERQRVVGDPSSDRTAIPQGGKLIVRDAGQHDADLAETQIRFINGASTTASGLEFGDQAGGRLDLSTNLVKNGFSRFDIQSDGRVELGTDVGLNLAAGGEFVLSGRQVLVDGDITAAGGRIDISSRVPTSAPGVPLIPVTTPASSFSLTIGKNAHLSTAGNWANDFLVSNPDNYAVSVLKGGSIKLSSADDLHVESGSVIDVSGGARVTRSGELKLDVAGVRGDVLSGRKGRINTTLLSGAAGSIELASGRYAGSDAEQETSSVFLNGELRGYSLVKGGSLTVTSSRIRVGGSAGDIGANLSRADRLATGQHGAFFSEAFFRTGGFYEYSLAAIGDTRLTPISAYSGSTEVAAGASIRPDPYNWFIKGNYLMTASGASMDQVVSRVRLHDDLRAAPTSLSLSADRNLTVGLGSQLSTDKQGSIRLSTYNGQLTVLGSLQAKAGTIRLERTGGAKQDQTYDGTLQSRSIYLGEESRLDVSGTESLQASVLQAMQEGVSEGTLRSRNQFLGTVLDGGKIVLDAGNGYLITREGSLIDVDGASASLNAPALINGVLSYGSRMLGSSGGQVSLLAGAGMLIDGALEARGAGGASNGVLSVRLDRSAKPWVIEPASPPPAAVLADRDLQLYESATHTALWTLNSADTASYLAGGLQLAPATYNGIAKLNLTKVESAGFGSVFLQSQNRISFDGAIDFAVANQLRLDAANFHAAGANADVKLAAAAVQIGNYGIGNAQGGYSAAGTPGGQASYGLGVQAPDDKGYTSTKLTVEGRDVALVGNFSMNGFADSRYASRGELHFDSQSNVVDRNGEAPTIVVNNDVLANPAFNGRLFNGSLKGTGKVEFSAGRVSPSIFSDFVVDLSSDPNGQIIISHAANADALGPLISAGGRLAFRAPSIEHGGRIEAPLGVIEFDSPNGTVLLKSNSITSVAASSVMPLGQTVQSGKTWEFLSALWNATGGGVGESSHEVTIPLKNITINADNSQIASGAQVDLSGGGDAAAWEFTPGPGGKTDFLTLDGSSEPRIFAILPGWSGNFAPADSQNLAYYNVSNPQATSTGYVYDPVPSLKAGDQIELGSNPTGLSGKFTLLPAKYALLKGAVLVTVKPGETPDFASAQVQSDGSWLVAGTRLAANLDGSYSRYGSQAMTVEVAPQSVVLARGRYETSTVTDRYFGSSDQLPGDAGALALIGRTQLSFDPVIRGDYVSRISHSDGRSRSGYGAQMDIAAPKIEVVNAGDTGTAGWVTLDKASLNKLNVASLLIGGVRHSGKAVTDVDIVSEKVVIATSGSALKAGELILVADDEVRIKDGASVQASGVGADAPARSYNILADAQGSSDGAFARVGSGQQASLTRGGTVNRSRGDLVLESGASISGRALNLDASGSSRLDGQMALRNSGMGATPGGSVSIGAGRINVIGDASVPADGLNLSNLSLQTFSGADQIRLVSYSTLDMHGDARLGDASVKELVISSSGIAGHGGAGTQAEIAAQTVRFENPNYASTSYVAGDVLGSGSLEVNAQKIEFAQSADAASREGRTAGFAVRGYNNVALNASSELRFSGVGVTAIDNDAAFGGSGAATQLNVNAGRIVAAAGADHAIASSGHTSMSGGGNNGRVTDLGGSLDWRASALDIASRIVVPAGNINLQATSGDVLLRQGAYIGAEGATVQFADTKAYALGGKVVLKSDNGNIEIRDGATVSVSGGEGGDAGRIELLAQNGTVSTAAGSLGGKAGQGSGLNQGELLVDAGNLNLNALVAAVRPTTGEVGFGGAWEIRQRSGDIELDTAIRAASVSLAADTGNVTLNSGGLIDASGSKGGKIALYAGSNRNVTLKNGSQLKASATDKIDDLINAGTRGQGGEVLLSARGASGAVVTETGSRIEVGAAADSLASGGKVVFRANESASTANQASLNIRLQGEIAGASDVGAEFVRVINAAGLKNGTTTGAGATQILGVDSLRTQLTAAGNYDYDDAVRMANLRNLLGFGSGSGDASRHIRAGVELVSSGDFSIPTSSTDIHLGGLNFLGEAGVLTIQAAGNVTLNKSLSDGFSNATRTATLNTSGNSWSYRMVAGRDAGAANFMATDTSVASGNLAIGPNVMLRTGNGGIALAAAKDIRLAEKAAVYTAGTSDTANNPANFIALGFGPPSIRPEFGTTGGDISLNAGGQVHMTVSLTNAAAADARHPSEWLIRAAGTADTQWYTNFASFQQGVGAFGGSDISIAAGGDIRNLEVVIPTHGRINVENGASQTTLGKIGGGGDLDVRAVGNVNAGLYYAESGNLRLRSERDITGQTAVALGNTDARVSARGSMTLGDVFNPLLVRAAPVNSAGNRPVQNMPQFQWRMASYTDLTHLQLSALNSDIALLSGTVDYGAPDYGSGGNLGGDLLRNLMPSRVDVVALNGGIAVSEGVSQAPGAQGQLNMLAARDIAFLGGFIQHDTGVAYFPSITNPVESVNYLPSQLLGIGAPNVAHASQLWHANDREASRVIARDGNISGPGGTSQARAQFNEAVQVRAGGDIVDLGVSAQHVNAKDVTTIQAGGDIRFTTDAAADIASNEDISLKVTGLGRLEVMAAGNIDLGNRGGILTRGNLENPYLPEQGADILVLAGSSGPDYAGFAAWARANLSLSAADLQALNDPARLREIFFAALRDIGRAASASSSRGAKAAYYARGRKAIAALFPDASTEQGNIDLYYSQIKTEQGGNIEMFTPGGGITLGIANPATELMKPPAEQGIFSIRGGDISAFVERNFLVNQSRAFTLDGGDILVWSNSGNIDAGSGAKTVISTPPPTLVIRNGQAVLDTAGSVAGSGIGTLVSRPTTPASDLDLFAPEGNIDAGDAGLRSSGRVFLEAQKVINANNIVAAGGVTGAPPPPSVSVPVSAPANAASNAKGNDTGAVDAAADGRKQGMLTVEVLDGGEDAPAPAGSGKKDKDKEKGQAG